jgi:hypothetical protein
VGADPVEQARLAAGRGSADGWYPAPPMTLIEGQEDRPDDVSHNETAHDLVRR